MHFTCPCPAATIRLCAPATMSQATETRLNMHFNDTLRNIWGHKNCRPCTMCMGQTAWLIFWAVLCDCGQFSAFHIPAGAIWLCAPASMSPAAGTRLDVPFNDTFNHMKPSKLLDTAHIHGPNRLADILRLFMRLWTIEYSPHVPQPQSNSAHVPACLRPLKRDRTCFFITL